MAEGERDDEAEEPRDEPDEPSPEASDEAAPEATEDAAPEAPAASRWADKAAEAWKLWEAGDNARLKPLVAELERAPAEEVAAREAARELGRRLKPDPIAVGLWVVSLVVFGIITYYFVIH